MKTNKEANIVKTVKKIVVNEIMVKNSKNNSAIEYNGKLASIKKTSQTLRHALCAAI